MTPRTPQEIVDATRKLADEVLAPKATLVDTGYVAPPTQALADIGLYGISGPEWAGGSQARPAVIREIQEILAPACPNTWFLWQQHQGPVSIAGKDPSDEMRALLGKMCTGEVKACQGFAQLRHDKQKVSATPVSGGYRFDGLIPYISGWGTDVLLVAGATKDGQAVFGITPAKSSEFLRPTPVQQLAVLTATNTVQATCNGLFVPDSMIANVTPLDKWQRDDVARTADAGAGGFGITRAALDGLRSIGTSEAVKAADSMGHHLEQYRHDAYELADDTDNPCLEERLAIRAKSLDLARDATTAYVTAIGGRAMYRSEPSQLWARTAMFLYVQGQTNAVQHASLKVTANRYSGPSVSF